MTLIGNGKRLLRDNQPLAAFDLILKGIAAFKHDGVTFSHERVLAQAAEAICRHLGIEDVASPTDALFAPGRDQTARRFVSVCLLRLLAADEDCFTDTDFRSRAFRLFDEFFAADLYNSLKIDDRDQTYQKQTRLRTSTIAFEADIAGLVSSLTSLSSIPAFRQWLMQQLRSYPGRTIVPHFTPTEASGLRLDEVFNAVEVYHREVAVLKIPSYESAISVLTKYRDEVTAAGTTYGQDILGRAAATIIALIERDFRENPLSKSASLHVEAYEKKYPLLRLGAPLTLVFTVVNDGPGHAFDVSLRVLEATDVNLDMSPRYLGHLPPDSVNIDFPARVTAQAESVMLELSVDWRNYDRTTGERSAV
jgi:hypothetical protein